MIERLPGQAVNMGRLIGGNQIDCYDNLRMDQNTFGCICVILKNQGGLVDGKHVSVEEQVVFLSILAHHKKNRIVKFYHQRSGQTVSHYVNTILLAILRLHSILFVKPVPIPDDITNPRWKWFKGCLGAIDDTYVNVHVPEADKGRYRTRKDTISTNVLAACDRNCMFTYILPGWEGSTSDARVLQDSISRVHGLKVPIGNYYLCDNGYANSPGFLAPYRSVGYHLSEWGPQSMRPQTYQEYFNMRHTRARNVIERAFGIIRSASFYPI
ncbi:hypothetical protein ACS0TY_035199 [Phlomoides rotata]